MTDFPYANYKLARNCLVSVGLPAPARTWTGTEIKVVSRPSKFVNLILWRLVADVLNGVAADMVKVGAIYINTDGYIVPDASIAAAFDVLGDWGLEGRVKHYGEVDVAALGSYAFTNSDIGGEGYYATGNYKRKNGKFTRPYNKIDASGAEWLRPRFKKYGEFAQLEYEWSEK
jgi:hypothetical protein